jgi:uncharacterized membrane protein
MTFLLLHRLFPAIHLPTAGNDLFPMARIGFIGVIYTIIASQMKTRNTNTATIASRRLSRIHSFMAIAGVMIAIICSLVLIQDGYASQHSEARGSSVVETSKFAVTGQAVKFKELSILSSLFHP